MLKRSKKILLEGTLDEFKNYPRGAEGREYVLMNIEEKKPDGSYAFYEKDEKGDIIPVSYKGTEGYDAADYTFIQFKDPEFKRIILANFNTNPKGGITTEEADAVTDIGGLFKGNTVLVTTEDLALLKNVKTIPIESFQYCTSLQTAVIPNGIIEIGEYSFLGCTQLTSIIIPNSVTEIGDCAFEGCSSLTSIAIPSGVTRIGESTFYGCISLTSMEIPNSATEIRNSAFEGCTNLSSIEIPDSVTAIGYKAFFGCTNLTSVEIPNTVDVIWDCAFSGCTGLTYIKCYGEVPASAMGYGSPFDGITSTCTLYVPINSLEAYQTANCWKDFQNIVGFEPEV